MIKEVLVPCTLNRDRYQLQSLSKCYTITKNITKTFKKLSYIVLAEKKLMIQEKFFKFPNFSNFPNFCGVAVRHEQKLFSFFFSLDCEILLTLVANTNFGTHTKLLKQCLRQDDLENTNILLLCLWTLYQCMTSWMTYGCLICIQFR